MAGVSYYEQLRDPRWQRKRLEVMEAAGWACEKCGETAETFNVHHSYYEKGVMAWDYPNHSLHCLCETCHADAQETLRVLHQLIGHLTLGQIEELVGMAMGLVIVESPSKTAYPRNHEELHGLVASVSTSILPAMKIVIGVSTLLFDRAAETLEVTFDDVQDACAEIQSKEGAAA